MSNRQTPLEPNYDRLGELAVHSVWKTIQGEGPLTGTPAIFVRVYGCNLKCPSCDTDYTSTKMLYNPESLLKKIQGIQNKPCLVVLTGGEPLIQNVVPFISLLLQRDYHVQIETNGTFCPPAFFTAPTPGLSIVCSPKMGYVNIPQNLITAWKYIIEAGHVDAEDGLPTRVLGMNSKPFRPGGRVQDPQVKTAPIYVQPQDDMDEEKNKANTLEAVRSCMQFGYILSTQIHKIVGVE